MSAKTKRKEVAENSNKPVLHVRVGGVRIPIWRNDGEDGPYFKAGEPELSYRGKDEQYRVSKSYGPRDLVNLIKAAALAHSEILRLNREAGQETAAEDEAETD